MFLTAFEWDSSWVSIALEVMKGASCNVLLMSGHYLRGDGVLVKACDLRSIDTHHLERTHVLAAIQDIAQKLCAGYHFVVVHLDAMLLLEVLGVVEGYLYEQPKNCVIDLQNSCFVVMKKLSPRYLSASTNVSPRNFKSAEIMARGPWTLYQLISNEHAEIDSSLYLTMIETEKEVTTLTI